jgi:archaellum component FlaD/FlaE
MIKVSDRGDGDDKITDNFDLDKELSIIIEKKLLSQKFANKIGEKLKKNKIKISKEQLYELVGKIQEILKSYTDLSTTDFKRKEDSLPNNDYVENISNTDMQRLIESIEKLENRVKSIEDETLAKIKGVTGRIVKTKDIKTIEKPNFSLQEEIEPLLEIPNDPESIVVLMKWLQYLVDKLGKVQLPNVLGYYVDIDWISDDVRLDLIEYSKGITDSNKKDEPKKELTNLTTKDHIQSLLFIQKLKGNQLDERFIWRIDRELEKMSKSIEDYQFN